jgi:hypothetical protein
MWSKASESDCKLLAESRLRTNSAINLISSTQLYPDPVKQASAKFSKLVFFAISAALPYVLFVGLREPARHVLKMDFPATRQ